MSDFDDIFQFGQPSKPKNKNDALFAGIGGVT